MMYEYACTVCPRCHLTPTIVKAVESKAGVEGRWTYAWVTHCGYESEHIRDLRLPYPESAMFDAIDNWNKKCEAWNL